MENKNLQEVKMVLSPDTDKPKTEPTTDTGGNGGVGGGGTGDTGGSGGGSSDDPK